MKRVLVAIAACAPPAPPPCAEPTPDPAPFAISTTGVTVVWSSESTPFDLGAPDRAWFECPRAIEHAFERQPDLPLAAATNEPAIEVDPRLEDQPILGFGISMEQASVANLLALPAATRDEVLVRLFDRDRGMGTSLVRVTIGTSDFTGLPWYSYEDTPGAFTIQPDIDAGIVAILQRIRAIAPDVEFFASSWSPPAWMKTTGSLTGGALRDAAIPQLAVYYRKFVEAYRDLGIPITALTLQNEPRADNPAMPSCVVTPAQEAALAIALKQELRAAGLPTRIWIFDHNFDDAVDYASDAFADPAARAASDGVAFHDYAGEPTAIAAVRARFPEQPMLFTEKTLWGIDGVARVADYFRNGASSYVAWVTMLDQNGKPNNGPNTDKPRRFTRAGDRYWATPEHFLFGLYAKFVRPGAHRIASSEGVAFRNPDGSLAVIVSNEHHSTRRFILRIIDTEVSAQLPPRTAGVYVFTQSVR